MENSRGITLVEIEALIRVNEKVAVNLEGIASSFKEIIKAQEKICERQEALGNEVRNGLKGEVLSKIIEESTNTAKVIKDDLEDHYAEVKVALESQQAVVRLGLETQKDIVKSILIETKDSVRNELTTYRTGLGAILENISNGIKTAVDNTNLIRIVITYFLAIVGIATIVIQLSAKFFK